MGLHYDRNHANYEFRITRDGSIELFSATQDIGGGIRTAMAQCAAEELGVKASDIMVKIGDTQFPDGAASGGSQTTNSMTPAARNAAYLSKRQLFEQVAPALNAKPDDLTAADGKIFVAADPNRTLRFRAASRTLQTAQLSPAAS